MSRAFSVFFVGLVACNYDVGECWLRSEDSTGAGTSTDGDVLIPSTGAGDYYSVPLEPQSHTGLDEHPCVQLAECTVTWKAGSVACDKPGASGTCTTLYQGKHESLDEAKTRCERTYVTRDGIGAESCGLCRWATSASDDPVEKCKKRCDRINRDCITRCPKGDKNCMYECNVEYGKCLKDCE